MADPRFFIDSLVPVGDDGVERLLVVARPQDVHHMVNVARLARGEHIEVVTRGDWRSYRATVGAIERGEVATIELVEVEPLSQSLAPFEVTLAFGLAKGDKTDTIVRQAVELGVVRVLPTMFQRSVVRLTAEKVESRRVRLQAIAESAAKQSHQPQVPMVDQPAGLSGVVNATADHDLTLIAWEEANGNELSAVIERAVGQRAPDAPRARIMLVVGPEGGIDATEVASLVEAGGVTVTLGPSILRVDTAAAVGLGVTFDALRRSFGVRG